MDSGMFYGIQKGAIAALQSGPDWFEKLNVTYAKRRELIFTLADNLGCTYDRNTAGLFVWAKLPQGIANAEAYVDSILYDKHIFLTPGTVFGSAGEGYVRFSLCCNETMITQAIDRLIGSKTLNLEP